MLGDLDGRGDLLGGLLAHARNGEDRPVGDDAFEVGEALDVERLPQGLGGLGAQAGHVEDLEQAGGDAGQEFGVLLDLAGGRELLDLVGDLGADAVEGEQGVAVGGDGADVLGQVLDGAGGAGVGVDAELVLAEQLEDRRHLLEASGEGGVGGHWGW